MGEKKLAWKFGDLGPVPALLYFCDLEKSFSFPGPQFSFFKNEFVVVHEFFMFII